ncbi:MAG: aminomethyl-transferring glycine dehydrogenase subunit GcvPA [Candidatus Micrarchaeia archaeon]
MNFIPLTEEDKRAMLAAIGVASVEELIERAALAPRLNRPLNLPQPMSEMELADHMQRLSEKNRLLRIFRGAGAYNHYIPSVVNHLLLRGEFYTAYTPYQPEVSQGTLQAIYEFQTLVCLLTSMDVANAGLYETGSALAEAFFLSRSQTGRREVFVANPLNPEYEKTLRTYARSCGFRIGKGISEKTACAIVQNPNYFGCIEKVDEFAEAAHAAGALLVVAVSDPTSLALLKPPGECGADIVVGDLQAFGNSLSFGGPYGAFMAVRNEHVKKMPGRLVGMTVDTRGQKGFILTLQAREQHIRREKATSNICTNHALNTLAATIYLALMGRSGLRRVAALSFKRAHELQQKLAPLGFALLHDKPFYNEFAVSTPISAKKLNRALLKKDILGGLPLGRRGWLLCATEMTTGEDIEEFVAVVGKAIA